MMFWVAAVVALAATALAVTRGNPVHGLLWFVVSLLGVAVLLFALGAAFAAALEVIVYAGAIVVLFLFVVMMLSLDRSAALRETMFMRGAVWVFPAGFVAVLGGAVGVAMWRGMPAGVGGQVVAPAAVGARLFGADLVLVELASVLLLAGLVAAFHLGRERT